MTHYRKGSVMFHKVRCDDESLTSLGSDADSDAQGHRRNVDNLDYQDGDLELEELENGVSRRRRRLDLGFKGRLFGLCKRVGKWRKLWSFKVPYWASAGLPRWQCPPVPENWRNASAVVG
jgi:hypothetical protein